MCGFGSGLLFSHSGISCPLIAAWGAGEHSEGCGARSSPWLRMNPYFCVSSDTCWVRRPHPTKITGFLPLSSYVNDNRASKCQLKNPRALLSLLKELIVPLGTSCLRSQGTEEIGEASLGRPPGGAQCGCLPLGSAPPSFLLHFSTLSQPRRAPVLNFFVLS